MPKMISTDGQTEHLAALGAAPFQIAFDVLGGCKRTQCSAVGGVGEGKRVLAKKGPPRTPPPKKK